MLTVPGHATLVSDPESPHSQNFSSLWSDRCVSKHYFYCGSYYQLIPLHHYLFRLILKHYKTLQEIDAFGIHVKIQNVQY